MHAADGPVGTSTFSDSDRPLAGRYQLLGLVGSGGMGSVFRAHDVELDETVALKVLKPELVAHPDALTRFRQEVKLARRVTHPNVARVFDLGEHEGHRFLTMEYVDGGSLHCRISREKRLSPAAAVAIARAVAQGLEAVHAAGVVHRDLKPDNVLLARDGRVVLTDFGIARALRAGEGLMRTGAVVLGTPEYMAPEQVDDRGAVDARADLYALGAVLFELLTGKRPWTGPTPLAVMVARLMQPPPHPLDLQPDLPGPLADLVHRLLSRDPADRPASAAEVLAALAAADLGGADTLVGPPPSLADAPARAREVRVAVLPVHHGLGADGEHLADGVADELTDALSGAVGLRVTPRGQTRGLEAEPDARATGRRLGANAVVETSLVRLGDRVHLRARLISVDDGFQFWARRYEGGLGELLRLAGDAARDIAEALTAGPPRSGARALTDPIALDLYLRARREYHRMWREAVARSVSLFDQALARAPEDPLVLAGAALARARLVSLGSAGADGGALVRRMAERALAAAPGLAEARVALAAVELAEGDSVSAARALIRALADAPALPDAHELMGRILIETGPVETGIRELEVAYRLEPNLLSARLNIARALALEGRWDEAWEQLAAPEADSELRNAYEVLRARLALWSRDQARATRQRDECGAELFMMVPVVQDLLSLVRSGQLTDEARARLLRLTRLPEAPPRLRAFFEQVKTEAHAFEGALEDALASLAGADDAGLVDLAWLEGCPLLAPLRSHSAYAPIARRVRARAEAIRGILLAR